MISLHFYRHRRRAADTGPPLYFVFVAGVFFLLGLGLTNIVLGENANLGWTGTIIGLVVGGLAALLATSLQETLLRIVGALAGAGGTYMVITLLNTPLGGYWWAVVIAGGVLGFILVMGIFELALVLAVFVCRRKLNSERRTRLDG